MRYEKLLSGLCALPLVCAGCSNADDGDVETASVAWRSVRVASQSGQQEFYTNVEHGSDAELTMSCVEGGSLTLDGRISDKNEFSLNLAFDACGSEGVVVDGLLSISASIALSGTSAEIRIDYIGQLEVSGEVELSCEIDATGRIAAEATPDGGRAELRFSGRICGASADAVVEASA
jgi:hypothetical protein